MNQGIKTVLLAAILGGLSILVAGTQAGAQNPGESNSNSGDHGDNPVVGSLPIEAAPDLDLMFVGDGHCSLPNPVSILGFLGSTELEEHILDAGGVPLGRVNHGSNFTILGLENPGFAVFAREDGRAGEVELKQWLEDAYFGGSITMSSNIGSFAYDINVNLATLPLRSLCTSIAPMVDAWITVSGASDSNVDDLLIHIVAAGEIVTVTYIP